MSNIRLQDIKVTSFRSLVDTKVSFKTNLTALIGINGAGKTNILQSILILQQLFQASSSNYDRLRYRNAKADETTNSTIECTFETDQLRFKLKADIYFDVNQENNPIAYHKIKLRNADVKPSRWKTLSDDSLYALDYLARRERSGLPKAVSQNFLKRHLTDDEKLNSAFIDLVKCLSEITYYSATQFSDPSRSPVSLELSNDRLVNRSARHATSHNSFIYDLFRLWKFEDGRFLQYMNVVGPNGLDLVDSVQFSEYEAPSNTFKVLTGGHIKEIVRKRTIVVPNFTVDGLQLSPSQLSEGTFKTLALAFHILNDRNDIILIEEPEVSVHHGLLGNILELIKIQSEHKQIIMSTHSDYVLDKLNPDNVVIVKKTLEGTKANGVSETLSATDLRALKMYLNEIGNLGDYWKEGGFLSE